MEPKRKRYALVGASHRALNLFIEPMREAYAHVAEIVAMVDIDLSRAEMMNQIANASIPIYHADDFDRMVAEAKPDVVIVATIDSVHHVYIIRALELGIDVISEKPVTTDAEKCRAILKAEQASKAKVTVAFNFRYVPAVTKLREMIIDGAVGRVVSVDLNWYLDTYHGSSFFMRWNRLRKNSGGLSVHKAIHHFDMVRWLINQKPVEIHAFGARNFYGPEGPRNPRKADGRHCPNCPDRGKCDYYMRWHIDEYRGGEDRADIDEHVGGLQKLSHYRSYASRCCIYDSEIDIEDTYVANVRYDGGAMMSYSFNCSMPYEGLRLGINGLDGRLEMSHIEAPHRAPQPENGATRIVHMPMFRGYNTIYPGQVQGGHGGADARLCDDLFLGHDPNAKVVQQADLMDGLLAVLTGVAVWQSSAQGKPIRIEDLLAEPAE